jgi:hypothetical protein
MRQNYQRLAWIVLVLAFALCAGLAVGVPWALQSYLRYAYIGELVIPEVQEGNLLVTCPGDLIPVAIEERQDTLCQGREDALVNAGPSDKGLLTIRPRTTFTTTLATIQLYPGARITVQQARAPRFPLFSSEPHRLVIKMESGRIRVRITANLPRTMVLQVGTLQALVELKEGDTSIEVNNQASQVVVREGQATVTAITAKVNNSSVLVEKNQRVVVPTGNGVTEVMPAEQNLLAGYGDFREPLNTANTAWKIYTKDPEFPNESRGDAFNISVDGRQAVEFSRDGVGWAETGIKQDINRDIRDLSSLVLRIELRVLQQDVPVCGSMGTECPVMVVIDYVDESGEPRSWQQGFYYLPDPNPIPNPPFCKTCNPRNKHLPTTNGEWYPWESENLIPILNKIGAAPVILRSISIYASGHKYQSQVSDVELLGQ